MITVTGLGESALNDDGFPAAVREHNLIAFRQAWKKFDEAVPSSVRPIPQDALRPMIEKDCKAMQDMIIGDASGFGWTMKQLELTEDMVNRR